jgi:hypothetical protein
MDEAQMDHPTASTTEATTLTIVSSEWTLQDLIIALELLRKRHPELTDRAIVLQSTRSTSHFAFSLSHHGLAFSALRIERKE